MKARYILLWILFCVVAQTGYAQSTLEFVEKQGQWGDWFLYKIATQNGDVCLEKDGFRYILADPDNNYKADFYHHGQTKEKPQLKFHCYKVSFEGANIPEIEGERPQKVYYNYFLGNDATKWRSSIHPCRGVNYTGLYNGVDMHVFSEKGNIEYEFIVRPGQDVAQIQLKFTGQDALKIKDHSLVVSTSVGQVTEMRPYAYQYVNNNRVDVPCEYHLKNNIVTFDLPSDYDHTQQLIIDPIVLLCTLTGSTADNWGFTATYDNAGNFYAGGLVNTLQYGGHFPVSPGAFQLTFGGGYGNASAATGYAYAADISIIKYDPTLANRIYATYLGGSGNEHAHSMIVDGAGNLTIAGRTRSTDYPVTAGAYQRVNNGGWDIIVTKMNPAGTALVGSTYIGGTGEDGVNFDSSEYGYGQLKYNYGDDARSEVQVDNSGNIYVASCTNSINFPVTPSAISSTLTGLQNGVIFKMSPTLSTLTWSTYLSGNTSDAAYVLAFDTAQSSVYVAGGTNSSNFPTTAGTLWPTYQGGIADGFILKFNNNPPYNLQKGTFIGTSDYDQVYGIQVSSKNEVYVMGQSVGGNFPVTPGVHSNPNSNQFIMKLDSNLATNMISTVFGSGASPTTNISPVAFLVDTCENVYVSGWGGNLAIPGIASGECNGMETSSDAQQSTTDGRDFYFIVLGANMATLRYASYFGRNCTTAWEGEHVDGGTSRFSKQGMIYQGICGNCGGVYNASTNPGGCPAPFPTTTGAWSMVDSSQNCNEAALKIAFNIGPVEADITAGPSTSGCAPLTVNFSNSSNNALTYIWNFGDGTPTVTSYAPTHTFTSGGVYTVSLSAANSNACFRTNDTAYIVIIVDTNVIYPSFTYTLLDSCGPYVAIYTNTSIDRVGTPTYQWWLGDGTTYAGTTPPLHSYPDTGMYTIMMVMTDTGACNSPDTVIQQLHIYSLRVSAHFSIPDSICEFTSFTPMSGPANATNVIWILPPNGDTATADLPSIFFDTIGTFTIKAYAQNPAACNGIDSFIQTIKVLPVPVAAFTYAPTTPEPNVPTTFTNESVNATRYLWDLGDGATSTDVNVTHQYNRTGSYKVCLSAYNSSNCPSVVCKTIRADVEPLVGLPTGFSPNGDGQNDILYVRGAAISKLDLKIFNRWGQLVFETTNQNIGWDGTFNGQPQPIEAYAYVLNVWFIDGTSKELQGNITLLR